MLDRRQLPVLAVSLAAAANVVAQKAAPKAGSFEVGGSTLVSAMMMFLGNDEKVYILDKAEENEATFGGFPASGSVWDIATRQAKTMGVKSNSFCASGFHLPNGSFVTFGGNGAIGPKGAIGSKTEENNMYHGLYDDTLGDLDGGKAIRLLDPCTNEDNFDDPKCEWFDDPSVMSMQKTRWYSTAESLADGTIAIIGGFVNGGYINRNWPNVDPEFEGGAAECTSEFFPSRGAPRTMPFLIKTSGLNSYPHAFMMPSGKMFLQANVSTMLWDADSNEEVALPDMPDNIARVYPASGATAMLPLTPENNWNPTILFCGGATLTDFQWGNYSWPFVDTWDVPASGKCHSITPEPADGSAPAYVEEDDMLETRTMGQFIALPDLTLLAVNGGRNGTAGYSDRTLDTAVNPHGQSLATGPALTPALYDPSKPKGQRWSNAGFDASEIPRLYHSTALLLPDASVLLAGSNPNVFVNTTAEFKTEYRSEIFYPSYFAAATRPAPEGIPKQLTYGGDAFDITLPASSYGGDANEAAANTKVVLIRPGWTTHAMNMGQRAMQLSNSYTVNKDGSITLHVAQLPPNANLFQPGPTLFFVTVSGVPSIGKMVQVGSGRIEKQELLAASVLPQSTRLEGVTGTGQQGNKAPTKDSGASSSKKTGAIIGGVVAAIAAIGILGAVFGIYLARRRRAAAAQTSSYPPMGTASGGQGAVYGGANRGMRSSDTSAFVPLQQDNHSNTWGANASSLSLQSPYYDDSRARSGEYDAYHQQSPRTPRY